MNGKRYVLIATFLIASHAYAQAADVQLDSVQQGAKEYDWQTCIDNKSNSCLNNCVNSEDIHCNDNCNQMAKDKCLSQGMQPP